MAGGLCFNTRLLCLNYAANEMGKEGALAFAAAIRANTSLRHLNISFNKCVRGCCCQAQGLLLLA